MNHYSFQNNARDHAVSGKSSSSGSYSIGGSNTNVKEDVGDKTPTEKVKDVPEKKYEKAEPAKKDQKVGPCISTSKKEHLVPKVMVGT